MSLKIDVTQPLTDEQVRYLEARGRTADLARNRRAFGSTKQAVAEPPAGHDPRDEGAGSTEQADWAEMVDDMTVDQLKEELDDRNLDTTGKKADLQARLKKDGPPRD